MRDWNQTSNIVYGIEKWDTDKREWIPHKFCGEDLEEIGELIDLLQQIFPDAEMRPAQYTVKEFQHIRSFG